MDKMTKKIVGSFAAILVIAAAVLAVFFIMNSKEKISDSDEGSILLKKDLESAYPEIPTEVVKLYWRYNQYMYNEKLSDDDLGKQLKQLRKLYDNEFLADENNSFDKMLNGFKEDKKNRSGEKIVSAVVEKYDKIKVEAGEDGQKYATVITALHAKKSGKSSVTLYNYMCRTDKKGRWKILGWKAATKKEAEEAEVR